MKTLLQVRNLSIGIQKRACVLRAVEDVSFDVREEEIVGIVGESGSGKSLTALAIAGLLGDGKETSGEILYCGKNLLRLGEKEFIRIRGKEISMIFQEPFSSLNPLMKVGAQIAETLEIHGETDKALVTRKTIELMGKLGLDEKIAGAYPHQLSGGMCQRAMIALAAICRPRLLIADEPTTALDYAAQSHILGLMKEINREMGTSIIFISHDLSLVKKFCSRVAVMYAGRILEEGSAEEFFSHPAHEYTRGLLASIPDGTAKGTDLAAIPGKVPSLEEGRPSGCPFHPRCAKAMPQCAQEFPAARTVRASRIGGGAGGDAHTTRCILWEGA
ncbi:MAG: ABC transporter ATP-binding protein [Treponema sp.]|nr:ABC transporter ATP-binding protein [Treponema sp.]